MSRIGASDAMDTEESMKVGVIGTGHVGLITSTSLAALGHTVVGADADPEKIAMLQSGRMPFFEPGVAEVMQRCVAEGRLSFSDRPADAVAGMDVVFICVGTPPRSTGEANLAAVEQAGSAVGHAATGPLVIVEKSTVPAGTAERLQHMLALVRPDMIDDFDVVSNPEFLREGHAMEDAFEPERILVGTDSERALDTVRRVYRPLTQAGVPLIETDIKTAELAKHACNAFLAMKISYANALARLCDGMGADVEAIADVMGADSRIGRAFLSAGLGYGGYCFPKDLVAFERLAATHNYEFGLLNEVAKINDEAVSAALEKVRDAVWNFDDKRIAVFGLAFKPETDDVRFSPSVELARRLIAEGAAVVACDPHAAANAKAECPELELADDPYEAARGARCVVLATEWPDFVSIDLGRLAEVVDARVIVDARNAIDPERAVEAGFVYYSMGRPTRRPRSSGRQTSLR
jgi:UDPglucose 6-dehydrogenase